MTIRDLTERYDLSSDLELEKGTWGMRCISHLRYLRNTNEVHVHMLYIWGSNVVHEIYVQSSFVLKARCKTPLNGVVQIPKIAGKMPSLNHKGVIGAPRVRIFGGDFKGVPQLL